MSIRGIDAQLMVTRAAELVRDTSVQQKKNELMQDYLAVQNRALDEQEKQMVAKTLATQAGALQTDGDGKGGQAYEGEAQKREPKGTQKDRELLDQLVDTEPHQIDIQI